MASRWQRFAAGIAVVLLSVGTSRAGALNYQFDQTTYNVPVGGSVTVNVYLTETLTEGDVSLLAPGLNSAGVAVQFDLSGPGLAQIESTTGLFMNPAFNDPSGSVKSLTSGVSGGITGAGMAPVLPEQVNDSTYRIWLGSFTFAAGPNGSSTTIQAEDFLTDTTETRNGDGVVLDEMIAVATATILSGTRPPDIVPLPDPDPVPTPDPEPDPVPNAPEPTSLTLLGLGLIGAVSYRCRRMRPSGRSM